MDIYFFSQLYKIKIYYSTSLWGGVGEITAIPIPHPRFKYYRVLTFVIGYGIRELLTPPVTGQPLTGVFLLLTIIMLKLN
jgi:hypothetical protein